MLPAKFPLGHLFKSRNFTSMSRLLQVVSSLLAGAAVGSLGGSGLADSLGRKTTLLLDAIPLLGGALLAATASSLTGIIAGRVLSGIGIGLASALVPLYISEVMCFPIFPVLIYTAPAEFTDGCGRPLGLHAMCKLSAIVSK